MSNYHNLHKCECGGHLNEHHQCTQCGVAYLETVRIKKTPWTNNFTPPNSYWPNPPRQHIITWLSNRYPSDAAKFRRMKLNQLRAIWHAENKRHLKEAA